MNNATEQISFWTGASLMEALEIQGVMESEALIDWSEATDSEFIAAVEIARDFIRNGRRWE